MKHSLVFLLTCVAVAVAAATASAQTGFAWQGRIEAVYPFSITVGDVTCAKPAPVELGNVRIGAFVVIDCNSRRVLVAIRRGVPGGASFTSGTPVAPIASTGDR